MAWINPESISDFNARIKAVIEERRRQNMTWISIAETPFPKEQLYNWVLVGGPCESYEFAWAIARNIENGKWQPFDEPELDEGCLPCVWGGDQTGLLEESNITHYKFIERVK